MEITLDALQDLAQLQTGPCVSIVLPTHRSPAEDEPDRLLLRDLADSAGEDAARDGASASLVTSIRALSDRDDLWEHPHDALAVYLSDGMECVIRFDRPTTPFATVADHFDLVPLVAALDDTIEFVVLALSLNDARLLGGTTERLVAVDSPDLPHGLDEALRIDERPSSERARDHDVSQYLHLVDQAVQSTISDPEIPLVIAAVDDLFRRFVAVSSYPGPVMEAPTGNPEHLSASDLAAIAGPVIRRAISQRHTDLCEQIDADLPAMSTLDPLEVVRAATAGQVRTLAIDPSLADRSLASRAVIATLRHGGEIVAVDSPALGADGLAALLRYPNEEPPGLD